jgi:hypothetical protein
MSLVPPSLRAVVVLAILSSAGCRAHSAAPWEASSAYTYFVAPPPAGSWMLRVAVTLERAPSQRIVAPGDSEPFGAVEGSEGSLARSGTGWIAPACLVRCTLRYTVDLDALASACRRIDCSRRVGDAIVGTASIWMLRPEPMGDAVIRVVLRGGDPARFATGLRRDPRGGFVLRSGELAEASYTAFGSFRRAQVDVPGARLDVALLGAPLDMGDAATLEWIRGGASCVARLFGRFPTDAAVFVVPVHGADEVVFGRVMSLAGPSVVLLFGDAARAERARNDWVVVHELFHLGCPSFGGEGHWLEEGLATYYEPILRERAGWITARELWSHFAREMPRGLRRNGDPASLERRDDIDSTYWGGALFALVADVKIRVTTRGQRSLDDVVRAALAREGDASHTARLADFLRIGDEATGTRALSEVNDAWAVRGENVDLDVLWRQLGVDAKKSPREGEGELVELEEGAPLAAVRAAISASGGH